MGVGVEIELIKACKMVCAKEEYGLCNLFVLKFKPYSWWKKEEV